MTNLKTCVSLKNAFLKTQDLLYDMFIKPKEDKENESELGTNIAIANVKIEITEEGIEGIFIKDEPDFDTDYTDHQIVEDHSTESQKNELDR